ncbi:uncharacterized protein LOC122924155 [Bufo gargarizans]|uniref:uncharacterized protein LOC122924155 n=1 Tax=Bufo gargarizans TaxID=30331 RepID=UPI001CF29266|nr:uncharacterized protein LOC122924155 [Bufo gargarizans]
MTHQFGWHQEVSVKLISPAVDSSIRGAMAARKEIFLEDSQLDSSLLDVSMSSLQISELEESMDDLETSFVNRQKADDEELQELLSRMKKKTKALHPGPDYCFQNDPIWAPGEERPGPEPDPEKRLNNVTWCKCHNCTAMKSVTESICCLELEVLEHFLPESVTCVTQNTEFSLRCLDQETLVTAMITQTINYGRSIDYRKPKYVQL